MRFVVNKKDELKRAISEPQRIVERYSSKERVEIATRCEISVRFKLGRLSLMQAGNALVLSLGGSLKTVKTSGN